MYLFHDSHNSEYRTPFGAVPCGSEVFLALSVKEAEPGFSCYLRLWSILYGEKLLPMSSDNGMLFGTRITAPDEGMLLWYSFIVHSADGRVLYYGNNDERLGGTGREYDGEPPSFQITVYKPEITPDWYKNSIVYQIFPDRFNRGPDWEECQKAASHPVGWKGPRRAVQQDWDDTPYYTRDEKGNITRWSFFGGNLRGIIKKLSYLKTLGVGVIYLNPIFLASSNHKYDTADYTRVDPTFGGDLAFSELCREAEKNGISIIIDGVFSHTGADSVYFDKYGNYGTGACSNPSSPYLDWYSFSSYPDKYTCWWGVDDLPNVSETTRSYTDYIYGSENSVIRRWLRAGARGWRLDVADELPDSFISGIKKAMRAEKPDSLLMGEVWEDASNKESYGEMRRYFLGDELDCTMHYPFRTAMVNFILGRITAGKVTRLMMSLYENYPHENFYGALNIVGTHDSVRILTLLGEAPEDLGNDQQERFKLSPEKYALAKSRLKLISLLQYAFPGVPCIYYGDEAGLQGFADPYNRGTYPWGKEDQELLFHYRFLALIYDEHPVLKNGGFLPLSFGNDVTGCLRKNEDEEITALINRSCCEYADISVPASGYVLELISSREYMPDDSGNISVTMPPLSGVLLCSMPTAPEKPDMKRCSGIICHVSSLPSGKLDGDAEEFIDFLSDSGQSIWQVLPLNPTGKGNSPYWSPAVFAGNSKLLGSVPDISSAVFKSFCNENKYWLEDYAMYSAISEDYGPCWRQWPEKYRNRTDLRSTRAEYKTIMEKYEYEQCAFWLRWSEVLNYAHSRGISIIGDIPIYVSPDGADVWAHRDIFLLTDDGLPALRAGVPPDYFSPEGQDWGNPVYNWDILKKTGYDWWIRRLEFSIKHFDYVRLDHFRGFSSYFAIPDNMPAKEGLWFPGPGVKFFREAKNRLGSLPIIAEDLGLLDSGVHNLLKLTGFPGMNVWQFSSDEMRSMSREESSRRVFFTGTHDNQTLVGWCGSREKAASAFEECQASSCPWVISQLQDALLLDDSARLNVPGTPEGNWTWRVSKELLTQDRSSWLLNIAKKYRRI